MPRVFPALLCRTLGKTVMFSMLVQLSADNETLNEAIIEFPVNCGFQKEVCIILKLREERANQRLFKL